MSEHSTQGNSHARMRFHAFPPLNLFISSPLVVLLSYLDINTRDSTGNTALQYALGESNHLQLLDILFKYDVDVNINDNKKNKIYGIYPIHIAIMHPTASYLLTKLLLSKGANINQSQVVKTRKTIVIDGVSKIIKDRIETPLLHLVIQKYTYHNRLAVIDLLLSKGCDVKAISYPQRQVSTHVIDISL